MADPSLCALVYLFLFFSDTLMRVAFLSCLSYELIGKFPLFLSKLFKSVLVIYPRRTENGLFPSSHVPHIVLLHSRQSLSISL